MNLKVGDYIYQIERAESMPNGYLKWKAKITAITDCYIETVFTREKLDWLVEIAKTLAPLQRTFYPITTKNYFKIHGLVNLELIDATTKGV